MEPIIKNEIENQLTKIEVTSLQSSLTNFCGKCYEGCNNYF